MRVLVRGLCFAAFIMSGAVMTDRSSAGMGTAGSDHGEKLLVRFKAGVQASVPIALASELGARVVRRYEIVENLHLLEVEPGRDIGSVLQRLNHDPNVIYAERDQLLVADRTVPNDPRFPNQWSLDQSSDADVDAPEAWDQTQGDTGVIVAVIDTGIDWGHEDLAGNMWINLEEAGGVSGEDEDGNGYDDDIYGIDAVDHDSDPDDTTNCKHGTHVAGIIGAVGNNATGIAGMNWRVKLMALRFMEYIPSLDTCGGPTSGALECLQYVKWMKDHGQNIVATNNSWGGGGSTQSLRLAIEAIQSRGILFVAAAGNANRDNDIYPSYPADYSLPNIISVASTDSSDARSGFSSYGAHTVHLGAPGSSILSTTPENNYAKMGGTSMAAPHVTGLVALLKAQALAQHQERDWRALKSLALTGGDAISSMAGKTMTGYGMNANGALNCSGRRVQQRIWPPSGTFLAAPGQTIDLRMMSIECDHPFDNRDLRVLIPPDEEVWLKDDGTGGDQVPQDGIFSGQWVAPTVAGDYLLTFVDQDGPDVVTVRVLPYSRYHFEQVPSRYEVIQGTRPTPVGGWDEGFAAITSPFPILFGGRPFNELRVCVNGQITFNLAVGGPSAPPLPMLEEGDSIIAPFMDDLTFETGKEGQPAPPPGEGIFWDVVGTEPNRKLIVEWRTAGIYSCETTAGRAQFQVVFTEGSDGIQFNYDDVRFGGACSDHDSGALASIGIQVGQTGTQYSYLTPSIAGGTSLMATPECDMILSPDSLPAGAIGTAYSAVVQASGGFAAGGYTYKVISSDFVPGLTLDATTGALSGIPSATGTYPFTIMATDLLGCSAAHAYSIVVGCPPIQLMPDTLPAATLDVPYAATITADGGVPPYAYSLSGGSLPPGLTLHADGSLDGTPAALGSFAFVVTATSANGCTGSHPYSIEVSCLPISIGPDLLPPATVGTPYVQTIVATGGQPPFTYASDGSMPSWLSLDATSGQLSGTPATTGAHLFTVVATGRDGCGGTRPFVVDVNPAGCPTISVDPRSLPDGELGAEYDVALTASGGVTPYAFTLTAGILPPGLTLTTLGDLSGLITQPGDFMFMITATDANGCLGSAIYSLSVPIAPPDLTVVFDQKPRLNDNRRNLTAKLRVANDGAGQATSSALRVYLSKDPALDPNDTLILERPIPPLGSRTESKLLRLRYTATHSLKGHYVLFFADADEAIEESDEVNNLVVVRLRR